MNPEETIRELRDALDIADGLLDDIDTAGDSFRPDNSPYFQYVANKCREQMNARRELLERIPKS